MFNAMYPSSHLVVQYHQIHHQQAPDGGRRMGRQQHHHQQTMDAAVHLMNFEVPPLPSPHHQHHHPHQQHHHQQGRRREPPSYNRQYHQHHQLTVMPPPPPHHHQQQHFRPVVNGGRLAEFSNPRYLNGKHTMGRLCHGISAPCLTTATFGGDESSDSGLSSRSPTPSRLHQSSPEESSEDSFAGPDSKKAPSEGGDSRVFVRNKGDIEEDGDGGEDSGSDNRKGRLRQNQQQQKHQQQYHQQQYHNQQQQYNRQGGGQYYARRRVAPPTALTNATQLSPGGRYLNHHHHNNNNNRGGRRIGVTLHLTSPYSIRFTCPPYNTAPDRYYARAHMIEVRKTPDCLTNGSSWDQLSCSVWRKFMDNQQTEDTFKKKMILWKYLYLHIKSVYPKFGLYMVGSTLSGFGSNRSDVDMCLIVRHCEVDQRVEAVNFLEDIHRMVLSFEFIEKAELIQAKVPILKFHDACQGLDVDLNCNNSVGIRNTHMLHCYSQLDWRVKPLVLVVKLWADKHNINNAKNMTISSYSLALMVIHFLQCGVSPPVLPCLHTVFRHKFQPSSDINSIDIHEKICFFPSSNVQPLGELLVQFFKYYANFDYVNNAISVRLASVLPIEECRYHWSTKNDPHQWKYLCIEEPFDLSNTARSVYDPEIFDRIRQIISESARLLADTLELESIFTFDSTVL